MITNGDRDDQWSQNLRIGNLDFIVTISAIYLFKTNRFTGKVCPPVPDAWR